MSLIHHFHIDHDVPCLPPIVFDFSWDDSDTLEKLETMVMQNFRGQTRYIIIYVKMVIIKAEKIN